MRNQTQPTTTTEVEYDFITSRRIAFFNALKMLRQPYRYAPVEPGVRGEEATYHVTAPNGTVYSTCAIDEAGCDCAYNQKYGCCKHNIWLGWQIARDNAIDASRIDYVLQYEQEEGDPDAVGDQLERGKNRADL